MKLRYIVQMIATSAFSTSALASSYSTLYAFKGQPDGAIPSGGVVRDSSGTLYGETAGGGTAPCTSQHGLPRNGCGTVFSFSVTHGFKVLANFHGPNGAYGTSGLTLAGSILIGATINGGASDEGEIYAVRTDGSSFTLVHQFTGKDGVQPIGPLIAGKAGIFYGITSGGGPSYPAQSPGVLFSLNSKGTYKILHSFSYADGANPTTLRGTPAGTLVGGTYNGGPANQNYCPLGCGVVFSFDPVSLNYKVLQNFDGTSGLSPYVGSVGPDGTIYGNNGNLFSISPSGSYQILGYGGGLLGYAPMSGPALAPDGNLYGTYTQNVGAQAGTLYAYTAGNFLLAYTFGDDGTDPVAEPIITAAGAVIGTTNFGGAADMGTIYQYTP